jgi:hypothetical protein
MRAPAIGLAAVLMAAAVSGPAAPRSSALGSRDRRAAAAPPSQPPTPLVDSAGLPTSLFGSYSAEAVTAEATNINEFKLGLNAGIFAEGFIDPRTGGPGVQNWTQIQAWLARSDAVGASVLFPLTLPMSMMFSNVTCCDEIIRDAMNRVMHHRSVVGWYLADEPDGARANGTADRVAAVKRAYTLVKSIDQRPVAACFDSTPPFSNPVDVHNFVDFLPYTDIALADIYPVTHGLPVEGKIVPGIELLRNHTDKPIVLVAQSFGGREVYWREPSVQEERLMVYLAWIHGASGVMYFEHEDAPQYTGGANQHLRSPVIHLQPSSPHHRITDHLDVQFENDTL